MEPSNVTIDNIIDDIANKLIIRFYDRIICELGIDKKRYKVEHDIFKKTTNALINCKQNDIFMEDIIKIQNIIKEKDEKIKETENRLKEIQDINIKLTTEFNKLLDKMHK